MLIHLLKIDKSNFYSLTSITMWKNRVSTLDSGLWLYFSYGEPKLRQELVALNAR